LTQGIDHDTAGQLKEKLIQHLSENSLVIGCWDRGDGRTKPPVSHVMFVAKVRECVDKKGAVVPE
jgi:hypothetical protein